MVGPCLCGDTECPSCGPLQGTYGGDVAPDGGPAFPRPVVLAPRDGATVEDEGAAGMTLRDYFAARAPDTIPGWYAAANPPRPYRRAAVAIMLRDAAQRAGEDVASVAYGDKLRDSLDMAQEAHDRAEARRIWLAWRWAYADAMLDARGE